jgi:hypothetical protein
MFSNSPANQPVQVVKAIHPITDAAARYQFDAAFREVIEQLRAYFSISDVNRKNLSQAQLFTRQLSNEFKNDPIVKAYEAAFLAIEAQYLYWALEKYQTATKALSQLDYWVKLSNVGPEPVFLRLAVCHNMPAIMNKGGQVQKDKDTLGRILNALDDVPPYFNFMIEYLQAQKLIIGLK